MLEINDLSGHFLISLENQRGSFFSKPLIWIINQCNTGSFGLVVNKLLAKKMRSNLRIKTDIWKTGLKIRNFGPVSGDRFLLVHESDLKGKNSLRIGVESFLSEYSPSLFADSSTHRRVLGGIGCSGWGPGQLESKIANDIWLVAPFDIHIVFDMPEKRELVAVANSIGIDLNLLPRILGQD